MTLFGIELWAVIGFLLGAYAIVANDAIQTLGTFLSSNSQRPWWVLWLYACGVLVAVTTFGFFAGGGDIGFGRLNQLPYPQGGIQWWHAVPPLFLLIITRYGVPVSTTFLVLTIFAITGGGATEGVMEKMLVKSGLGYVVAFVVGGGVYYVIARSFERWVDATKSQQIGFTWTVVQWLSTAFLWSQWLMQDLANIFIFLPRETQIAPDGSVSVTFDGSLVLFATLVMLILHAIIFATRGGEIQKIVLKKTNTTDIRAATVVDLIYGIILLVFKEASDVPMSTTWVFLGLLAGRELAISYVAALRDRRAALKDVSSDIVRALIGLLISVVVAFALPAVATGTLPEFLLGGG